MALTRPAGAEQPGWRWGPFTARLPFLHFRIEWPELIQGFFVAGATGLALAGIIQSDLGLAFRLAIALIFLNSVLIQTVPMLFGEPFAPGWITPALPLALHFIAGFATPTERIHAMTAVSLDMAGLFVFLGLTGLGRLFTAWLPSAVKAGILLGAAISALKRIFVDKGGQLFLDQPLSVSLAVGLSLLLLFFPPVWRLRLRNRWIAWIAKWGMLPGFLLAAAVGPMVGEVRYQIGSGWFIPPLGELFGAVSPFAIGWPTAAMFLQAAPLALVAYVIAFGDLVAGMELLRQAAPSRPDEKITIDSGRTHLSLGIRNALMALFSPFFPTQGPLWTGAHVVILQRWKEGRGSMDSLYGGLASYYILGIPVFYLVLPILTGLKPLMGVALSLTLALTAVGCAQVAVKLPESPAARAAAAVGGVAFAFFDAWVALAIALGAALALEGRHAFGGKAGGDEGSEG